MPRELSDPDFIEVIDRTTLVSFDLIVRDPDDDEYRILLGLRKNEPAINTWFVPGGRIKKGLSLDDASLDDAFERVCEKELKIRYSRKEAHFLGAFAHFYDTNDVKKDDVTTHYVVLAYEISPANLPDLRALPRDQHLDYDWFTKEAAAQVQALPIHQYTLRYFEPREEPIDAVQYQVTSARREAHNSLLWQTPVVSLTAQAFLFTIALGDVTTPARMIAATLAFVTAAGSIHLMMKHRFYEIRLAKELCKTEQRLNWRQISKHVKPDGWIIARSSYRAWVGVLSLFAIGALLILFLSVFCPSALSPTP